MDKLEALGEWLNTAKEVYKEDEDNLFDFWKSIININTATEYSKRVASCEEIVNLFVAKLEELRDTDPETNLSIDCRHRKSDGFSVVNISPYNGSRGYVSPLVFLGHLDTVYGPSDWKKTEIAHGSIDSGNDKFYGAGVLDMKGGIAVMLGILRMLFKMECFRKDCPIHQSIIVIFTYGEETGHVSFDAFSKFKKAILEEIDPDASVALSFETSPVNPAIVIGRWGRAQFKVTVTGKRAHAGLNKNKGLSAISGAMAIVRALESKYRFPPDVQCTVTKVSGGDRANAIPAECELTLDVRYHPSYTTGLMMLQETIKKACKLAKTKCKYSIQLETSVPPMCNVDANMSVAHKYRRICNSLEGIVAPVEELIITGAGDAYFSTLLQISTIDGLGVRGENNHTLEEFAYISSLKDQIFSTLAFLAHEYYDTNIGLENDKAESTSKEFD